MLKKAFVLTLLVISIISQQTPPGSDPPAPEGADYPPPPSDDPNTYPTPDDNSGGSNGSEGPSPDPMITPPDGGSEYPDSDGNTNPYPMPMPPDYDRESGGSGTVEPSSTSCDTSTRMFYVERSEDETEYPGGYMYIKSNNCPGYDWSDQTTQNKALQMQKAIILPLQPKLAKTPIYPGITKQGGADNSDPIMGAIGISINGVSIFGNADNTSGDAFLNEGETFDSCGGHPSPSGEYHYHAEPTDGCVYKDLEGEHSPLFGIMFDGIPIYGVLGDEGIVPTNLDECGGHVDMTNKFYHYHLPKDMAFPYTVSCLRGCIYNVNGNKELESFTETIDTCELADTQYDYSGAFDSLTNYEIIYNEPYPEPDPLHNDEVKPSYPPYYYDKEEGPTDGDDYKSTDTISEGSPSNEDTNDGDIKETTTDKIPTSSAKLYLNIIYLVTLFLIILF